MIEPSTEATSASGGSATLTTRVQSARRDSASRSARGIGGIASGRTMPTTTIHAAYRAASSNPGSTAAANSVPTESCMMSESRISTRLGGMIWPSVPDAQIAPHEIAGS